MMQRTLWLSGCLMFGVGIGASLAEAPSQQDFYCEQGSTTRIVSIITLPVSDRQPRGSCHVDYTKDKVTKTLWSSSTGHGYCIKMATAFVTKLAEDHYSCSLKTKEQPKQ
jgi:hypothetical protein